MPFALLVLRHLAILALLAATAWAAGRLATGPLRRRARSVPGSFILAVGLAAVAQASYLLGLAGGLRAPIVAIVCAGLIASAAGEWRRLWRSARQPLLRRWMRPGELRPELPSHDMHHQQRTAWHERSPLREAGEDSGLRQARPAREMRDASEDAASTMSVRGLALVARLATVWRVVVALVALSSFLLALYPPIGFDQTMYHLPFARAFAATGRIAWLPALRFPTFPQMAEALNASILLLAGDVATQLTGWLAMAASVALACVWTRELCATGSDAEEATSRHGLPEPSSSHAHSSFADVGSMASPSPTPIDRHRSPVTAITAGSWIAAACLMGSPMALYLAGAGYVEPLLALLGTASLYAAWRARGTSSSHHAPGEQRADAGARTSGEARTPVDPPAVMPRSGSSADQAPPAGTAHALAAERVPATDDARVPWTLLAGLLAGTTASVKYLGLFFVIAAAGLLIGRAPWRRMLRDLALFGGAALAALAPTYLHIATLTGNPVFPFYPELFGSSVWAWPAELLRRDQGAARLHRLFTVLWDLTFRRHELGGLPHVSPAFAFGAPLVIAIAWRMAALRRLLIIAVAWLALATTHGHHFLGIAPLWSVLIGAAAASSAFLVSSRGLPAARALRAVRATQLLIALAVALALGGEAYALYRLHRLGLPPATPEARARLLASQRPLHPAIAFLARTAGPSTIYVIDAPEMVDYAAGPMLGDLSGPASFARVAARTRALDSLAAALDEVGAAYLVVPARPALVSAPAPASAPTPANEDELTTFWHPRAAADPRLSRVHADPEAIVYRVMPMPAPR